MTDKTKRNANALMLFVVFLLTIPAVVYLMNHGGSLLGELRAIFNLY